MLARVLSGPASICQYVMCGEACSFQQRTLRESEARNRDLVEKSGRIKYPVAGEHEGGARRWQFTKRGTEERYGRLFEQKRYLDAPQTQLQVGSLKSDDAIPAGGK